MGDRGTRKDETVGGPRYHKSLGGCGSAVPERLTEGSAVSERMRGVGVRSTGKVE